MIQIRRLPSSRFRRRRYEVQLIGDSPDKPEWTRITSSPVRLVEPHLGVGDAWSVINAADRAWDGGVGEWIVFPPNATGTGTSADDVHGYTKLRSAIDSFLLELDELGMREQAELLRKAQAYAGGSPTEWMGETASALNEVLGQSGLPDALRRDMEETVDAIRMGIRRVGSVSNF